MGLSWKIEKSKWYGGGDGGASGGHGGGGFYSCSDQGRWPGAVQKETVLFWGLVWTLLGQKSSIQSVPWVTTDFWGPAQKTSRKKNPTFLTLGPYTRIAVWVETAKRTFASCRVRLSQARELYVNNPSRIWHYFHLNFHKNSQWVDFSFFSS